MIQLPIKRTIDGIPGGMMIVPLFVGALFKTFAPQFFGSFTGALFNAPLTILAVFYVCMGSTIEFTAIQEDRLHAARQRGAGDRSGMARGGGIFRERALVKAGIKRPHVGVCGINPHAGEHGLFGRGEEEQKILPAVEAARRAGVDVEGPLPADTLFFRAGRGDFDLVVAMYHDQGHGPVKVLGLEAGVNITVGLPFVRTSVDHGTAFDIAGTGKADERSMVEALRQAVALAPASSRQDS